MTWLQGQLSDNVAILPAPQQAGVVYMVQDANSGRVVLPVMASNGQGPDTKETFILQIIFSCFVFWLCGFLFGLIAFILARKYSCLQILCILRTPRKQPKVFISHCCRLHGRFVTQINTHLRNWLLTIFCITFMTVRIFETIEVGKEDNQTKHSLVSVPCLLWQRGATKSHQCRSDTSDNKVKLVNNCKT